jgi:hypothetical protein
MKKLMIAIALLLFAGIAFGQTLNSGSIVVIFDYEMTLQPDVTFKQFLEFKKTTFNPKWEKLFPGTSVVGLVGDRGGRKNKYTELWIFDSLETRDKFFPEEGIGLSALTDEQQETYRMLMGEQRKYVIMSQGGTSTDYKIQ